MDRARENHVALQPVRLLAAAVGACAVMGACASQQAAAPGPSGATAPAGECPAEPVEVVVTVGQWTDLATTLAGACGNVTTIVGGSSGDPHEFEPATSDAARFTDAGLVVVNGLGYDDWAVRVLATLSPRPSVVDAGEVAGLHDGDNPHVWYGPQYVDAVADAVTDELREKLPAAADYLNARRIAWTEQARPLAEAVATLRAAAAGRTFAGTEPVFDYMAAEIGLVDRTPRGFEDAAANEADPAPGDVYALVEVLRGGTVDVLLFNGQTESSLADRVRSQAEAASVPVVDVTETAPPGAGGFVAWQVGQLDALARALGVR